MLEKIRVKTFKLNTTNSPNNNLHQFVVICIYQFNVKTPWMHSVAHLMIQIKEKKQKKHKSFIWTTQTQLIVERKSSLKPHLPYLIWKRSISNKNFNRT